MIKNLPDCWWITPEQTSSQELISLLKLRISQDIRHVIFRQKNPDPSFLNFCHAHNIVVITNSYLNSDDLMNCTERPLSKDHWVGAFCHNLEELLHAQKLDLDFVSLSPVKKTLSHPEQTPMGWDMFEALVSQTSLPVYALGGLSLSDKQEAIARGGQGIMGIRFD